MKLHFYKYQGAGNDFIIIDARDRCGFDHKRSSGMHNSIFLTAEQVRKMCDRRFGIGGDGLMIIYTESISRSDGDCNHPIDFSMRYFNADGFEGSMCGNGGRCITAYSARSGLNQFTFSAVDGIHHAKVVSREGNETQICLEMINVDSVCSYSTNGFYLNTGSPHLVLFENNVQEYDVARLGAFWRNHPDFAPKGTNVNFVENEPDGSIFVRTFERGVENETLACGTGVTASAIASFLQNMGIDKEKKNEIHSYNIKTLGGCLSVSFQTNGKRFHNIYLTGPATFVYEGDIEY